MIPLRPFLAKGYSLHLVGHYKYNDINYKYIYSSHMPMSLELLHIQQAFARQEISRPFIQVFDQSALKFKQNLTITESLDVMFPEQKRQDKDVLKARETLGGNSQSNLPRSN